MNVIFLFFSTSHLCLSIKEQRSMVPGVYNTVCGACRTEITINTTTLTFMRHNWRVRSGKFLLFFLFRGSYKTKLFKSYLYFFNQQQVPILSCPMLVYDTQDRNKRAIQTHRLYFVKTFMHDKNWISHLNLQLHFGSSFKFKLQTYRTSVSQSWNIWKHHK